MRVFILIICFLSCLTTAVSQILPSSLSGLELWLHSDSIDIQGADTVSTIYDCSGNSRDASQVSPSKRPTYILSDPLINNYPSISFNGNNQYFDGVGFLGQLTDYTTLVVIRIKANNIHNTK